ncbi:MAG: hypothetical protein RL608_314 [Bacteroidota bacterium]
MLRTLTVALLFASLSATAQSRWETQIGLRTPPPQGGMFGTFVNYQIFMKVSPRRATAEPGTGRYALRFRTWQNSINYSHSEPNANFWMNANAMLGFERINRPKKAVSAYWGAEVGGNIGNYVSSNGSYFYGGPSASILYGVRARIKPRWTLAIELAPTASIWYNKSNETWQEPATQFTLSGQSIGLSCVYRI